MRARLWANIKENHALVLRKEAGTVDSVQKVKAQEAVSAKYSRNSRALRGRALELKRCLQPAARTRRHCLLAISCEQIYVSEPRTADDSETNNSETNGTFHL